MSDHTKIQWSDATWLPTTGCDRISPGCDNCYALTLAKRLKGMGSAKYQTDGDPRTSGPGFGLATHTDALELPLHWRKPRRVFVDSMSDLFHDKVPETFTAKVFAVMSRAPQHTFQILTKRPQAMRRILNRPEFVYLVDDARGAAAGDFTWPLPNVWLGVSVEEQKWADLRIPHLLATPAAVRFLSVEPMLGPVSLTAWLNGGFGRIAEDLHWVICGGESGAGARPMHPSWPSDLRDECVAAGVSYFFKQRGQWTWGLGPGEPYREPRAYVCADGRWTRSEDEAIADGGSWQGVWPLGKTRAGRELDGRTWDEYPA